MFCTNCGEQLKDGTKFCTNCGSQTHAAPPQPKPSRKFPWRPVLIASSVALAIFIAILYIPTSDTPNRNNREANAAMLYQMEPTLKSVGYFSEPDLFDSGNINNDEWLSYIEYTQPIFQRASGSSNTRFPGQIQAFSAVVKIVCEDYRHYYYGSGTNMDSSGYVLTNLHVIESDTSLDCMVGFPDPQSGLIREVYWATPIVDKEKTTGHDLAILSIEEPVWDDEYKVYGFYEKFTDGTFQYYEETDACLETSPQLGDQVFVLGYPTLTGGALTITDGLVSSLYSADGYLITSAKISSGNSGGLAVDSGGCFVGVPTAVYLERENEQYGEIIDSYFVYEFFEAVMDDIEAYIESQGWTEQKEQLPTSEEVARRAGILESNETVRRLAIPGALRSCPSTSCDIVRYYAEGALVFVSQPQVGQEWYAVRAHDDSGSVISGYMHSSLFE